MLQPTCPCWICCLFCVCAGLNYFCVILCVCARSVIRSALKAAQGREPRTAWLVSTTPTRQTGETWTQVWLKQVLNMTSWCHHKVSRSFIETSGTSVARLNIYIQCFEALHSWNCEPLFTESLRCFWLAESKFAWCWHHVMVRESTDRGRWQNAFSSHRATLITWCQSSV